VIGRGGKRVNYRICAYKIERAAVFAPGVNLRFPSALGAGGCPGLRESGRPEFEEEEE